MLKRSIEDDTEDTENHFRFYQVDYKQEAKLLSQRSQRQLLYQEDRGGKEIKIKI